MTDKSRRIEELRNHINKTVKKDAVRIGSDPYFDVKYLPTGIPPIDMMLGGGFPVGRSFEIFGNYSSLKSYVALKGTAETQRNGGVCAYIDSERTFDPEWAVSLGVDLDELIVYHPDTGEDAVAVTEVLVRDGASLVVWDSVASMQPKAENDKMPGEDKQPARRAAMMSKGLSRLTAANKQTTALVFVNQTRTNVGMTFGSNESVPGGKALPFYASMRLRMTQAGKITRDVQIHKGTAVENAKEIIGYRIKCELMKSKLNRPGRESWFIFDTENGRIDIESWLIAQGEEQGLITTPSKGWLAIPDFYGDQKMRRKDLTEYVSTEPELREWLTEATQHTDG